LARQLLNSDFDGGFYLFLFKGDSKDAIFKFGFDAVLVFPDLYWQSNSTGELTPVAFLDVPAGSLLIFSAAQYARDGEDVVGDADIEV